MDSDGEVILEVGPCGASRCAKVAWLRLPAGPDGQPLRDYRNSDPNLRSRAVCGLTVITGFEKQPDGTWGEGTVYVPDLGSSYSGYAEVLSLTQVKITGYIFLPLFGASEIWTKVSGPFQHCLTKAPPAAAPQVTGKSDGAPTASGLPQGGGADAAPAP
jgi:uncharacterized protein (DUF2147 family)